MNTSANWSLRNIAWASGLFEGEGCIGFDKDRGPHLQVQMTDEDVIRKLHIVIGAGTVNGPYVRQGDNRKPMWRWRCSGGEKVQAILAAFWNFLGDRRKAKASEVIQEISKMKVKPSDRKVCAQGHTFSKENTFLAKRGGRVCKECRKNWAIAAYHKKKNKNVSRYIRKSSDRNS